MFVGPEKLFLGHCQRHEDICSYVSGDMGILSCSGGHYEPVLGQHQGRGDFVNLVGTISGLWGHRMGLGNSAKS